MRIIRGQEELTFTTGPQSSGRSCESGCTGKPHCVGLIYLALDVADGPRLKPGWVHSLSALANRSRDHARAQLQIVWHATHTDDGMALTWDYEQQLHQAIGEVAAPYAGREYYRISQPVFTVLHRRLFVRCMRTPATQRVVDRLQRMHIADMELTHYRLENLRRAG